MHPTRLYSNMVASLTAAILLIAACAGCWERIEYTGPRTISAPSEPSASNTTTESATSKPPAPAPSTTSTETSAVSAGNADTDASPSPQTADPAPAATTESGPPKPEGDRYATPPIVETPPGTLPQSAAEPEKSTAGAPAESVGRHPDAMAASATADAAAPESALNSRRAAWILGSRLSLAALANDRGIAAKSVPIWLEDARTAAKYLGTTVADLPQPAAAGDDAPASRQVIDFLLVNGQRIGGELSKRHGEEQSALFEIALKSNILLLLYSPSGSAGNSIAAAISQAAPQAKLPAGHWQPLVDALGKQVPKSDVRSAVHKMHIDVDRYLAQPTE